MKENFKKTIIGAIPNSWKLKNLGDIAFFSQGIQIGIEEHSEEKKENYVRFIRIVDFTQPGKNPPRYVKNLNEKYHAKADDIIMIRYGTPGVIGRGIEGIIANNMFKINFRETVLNDYAQYYFENRENHNRLLSGIASSTMPAINFSYLKTFKFVIPPLPEQQKIADILSTVDEKIAVIDHQITATEELKKGLMQSLLTKGIGHTEFKDSPLGKIPKSWDYKTFGNVVSKISYGPRFSSKDYSDSGNVKTIRGTDISNNGEILYDQVPLANLPNELISNHKLKDGDLIMITTADCGLTAVYRTNKVPFIPSAYAVRIVLNRNADSEYFKYIFQTTISKNQVERFIRKGTVANLPASDIKRFKFAIPPVSEQKEIAVILSNVDVKLQTQKDKKQAYQQLKKGLMQQLLTGKIRVNNLIEA